MKKLKLKLDGIKEMLSKEQMQKINGGYGDNDSKCILITERPGQPYLYEEKICYGVTPSYYCYIQVQTNFCPGAPWSNGCAIDYCVQF
jgi:hypothetical protein